MQIDDERDASADGGAGSYDLHDPGCVGFLEVMYRVNRALVDVVRSEVAEVADLDISEFMVLRAAWSGAVSPGDLSRSLSTAPAVTSRTVTSLVRAGLLHRSPDPEDARRVLVELTDEGRRVSDLIAEHIRPALQSRFDELGEERTRLVLDALHDLAAMYELE